MQAKSIIETKKRKNTTRQCTYCGTIGHNRRTCAPLKDHIGQLVEASALYNAKVAKAFELSGIYVGALIQYKVEEYDYNKCEWIKENRMGIVSRVNLKSYNVSIIFVMQIKDVFGQNSYQFKVMMVRQVSVIL